MNSVLIIDDDKELCTLMKKCVEQENLSAVIAHGGLEGLRLLEENKDTCSLIILDVMMPDMNGFQVLQEIRKKNNVPVLMLTAKSDEEDKVSGLRLGADDYLTKPFGINELMARVNSLIRRYTTLNPVAGSEAATMLLKDMVIDKVNRTVTLQNLPVELTGKEFDAIKSEFGIEGDIIPMSCIVNNGDQDPAILINGFGEGYGDADKDRHIAVTDDLKVICAATQQGYREGLDWLHKLYSENLIDPECFTQEWSTYVSKGKAGRYGVCFSWDVANIDNLADWEPLPALTADTRNITPQNGSFTSGFGRGKCVVTAKASNPALVCAWLDQMYAPLQSPQNNWGTYGDETGFNIFEMSTNDKGEPMLKHAPLGDASPVEVREAQCVGGPLAVLDDYYGVYVTCPDDAQYRLDWIKDIYTPDMNKKYVYPNVFMSSEDTEQVSNLQADLQTYMNTQKANWIMNGTTDAEWNEYLNKLEAYKLSDYLAIMQKYLDAYYAEQ